MKDFFKYVGATVVGMLIVGIVCFIMSIVSLASLAVSANQDVDVKDNSVLVLNLSGDLQERKEGNLLLKMTGKDDVQMGLDELLSAIRKARQNDDVKGIYIEVGAFMADSYASLQALRRELEDFRKAGKWIVAYGDIYSQPAYYVASVADKVWLNPQGQVDWHGLAAQPMFYKDMLAKFGVKVQVAKVGTYKSAVEPYLATEMSDANREQVNAYLSGIWSTICKSVAASRKLTVAQLNAYADSVVTFAAPADYLKLHLVDALLYTDQVKTEVKKLLGVDADEHIHQLSVSQMNRAVADGDEGDEIAVYYAYGNIVDGVAGAMKQGHVIDAQVVCRDLEKLMDDDDVKAVVLRVNSGGGSAYASEQIWHQIMELKKKKPVVVSMGGMAASGAYYISAPADWIVAEPTTLTGSIGIFGMFPDVSGLLHDKLGLTFDEVKTNKHSTFGTFARPFTDEEMHILEGYISRGYQLFRQRVADGRRMKVDAVERIAQGRVWLGQDALGIKLVDQLGHLDDAVAKAAKLAKLDKHHTASYPAEASWTEQLLTAASGNGGNYLDEAIKQRLGIYWEPISLIQNMNRQDVIQARIPYVINMQ